jgi:hypothetical protein
MKTIVWGRIVTASLLALLCGCSSTSETGQGGGGAGGSGTTTSSSTGTTTGTLTAPPEGDATYAAVSAAEAFLATLTDTQKSAAQFAFADSDQTTHWSNLPTGLFARNGVKLGDMTDAQKTALFALLAKLLSASGYDQVMATIGADEALKQSSSGGNLTFGEAEYFVSILGTPAAQSPWRVQFGGHHLALNVTIVGANMTLAPSLTGAQPATYTLNGQTVRPQGAELDQAFALVGSLTAAQQAKAVIASTYMDLALGPGKDGVVLSPEGIVATDLTSDQRTMLIDLVQDRVGILNEEDAALRMAEIEANLDETYFAWAGPTAVGSAAYYRITGPTLAIEYAPQMLGGDAANHTHAMYRDPTNDYAAAWLK